jgi:hypothetical protein
MSIPNGGSADDAHRSSKQLSKHQALAHLILGLELILAYVSRSRKTA